MAKVEFKGASKLLLAALLVSMPSVAVHRAVAQVTGAASVTASATVPVTCGFDTSQTDNIGLVLDRGNSTLSSTNRGANGNTGRGAAVVVCNRTGANLAITSISGTIPSTAQTRVNLSADLGFTGATTETLNVSVAAPMQSFSGSSDSVTLGMGTTNIALDFEVDLTPGNFGATPPTGTYTYMIGLTISGS